jgi:putative hydrolase of the HAD superfamily
VIKNIIFDIGNVLLQWQPEGVVARFFPEQQTQALTQALFRSQHWRNLNLGKLTETELIHLYHRELGIDIDLLCQLMQEIKESLLPVGHSLELLKNLYEAGYSLFSLTDNVHEIMAYLKLKYNFWSLFKGVVVSAEVGYLKPMKEIYQKLIDLYDIDPQESVFIDDVRANVEGAKSVGLHGIQFFSTEQCALELNKIFNLYAQPASFRNPG